MYILSLVPKHRKRVSLADLTERVSKKKGVLSVATSK